MTACGLTHRIQMRPGHLLKWPAMSMTSPQRKACYKTANEWIAPAVGAAPQKEDTAVTVPGVCPWSRLSSQPQLFRQRSPPPICPGAGEHCPAIGYHPSELDILVWTLPNLFQWKSAGPANSSDLKCLATVAQTFFLLLCSSSATLWLCIPHPIGLCAIVSTFISLSCWVFLSWIPPRTSYSLN